MFGQMFHIKISAETQRNCQSNALWYIKYWLWKCRENCFGFVRRFFAFLFSSLPLLLSFSSLLLRRAAIVGAAWPFHYSFIRLEKQKNSSNKCSVGRICGYKSTHSVCSMHVRTWINIAFSTRERHTAENILFIHSFGFDLIWRF